MIKNIVAAIRTDEELEKVLKTEVETVFDLASDLFTLKKRIELLHKNNRKVFIHFDLATGIGKDKSGMSFVKAAGVDGIITTRANIIKLAKEEGLFAIQRFFILDSHSIDTTLESLKKSKADMMEIMPGIIPKIIKRLKEEVDIPVIAGGLIETKEEIKEILNNGAFAISTGKEELWNFKECR